MRLNLSIDDPHADVLQAMASRAHVQPGTLARSMLLTLLDDAAVAPEQQAAPPSGGALLQVLNGIPGSWERIEAGLREHDEGRSLSLDELAAARPSS